MAGAPRKTADKDKPEPQEDALDSAHRAGLSIDADFLHLVMAQIQVSDYLGSEEEGAEGISIPLFSTLRLLCVIDQLYQLSDAEILAKLKIKTTSEVGKLRKSPHYQKMLAAVKEAVKTVSSMTTMDEVAKVTEGRMAKGVAAMATRSKGARDRMKGLEAIVDRMSQKKSRKGEGGGVHLHFPPSVFASIVETHRVLQERVGGEPQEVRLALPVGVAHPVLQQPVIEDADEIDGSVVNVPLPEES